MNTLEAAIFDMDGVLVDSVGHNWAAINEVLAPHDVQVEQDQIGQYLGRSLEDQMQLLNRQFSLDLKYGTFAERVGQAKERNAARLEAKAGALTLLSHLVANDIRLAVATSMPRDVALQRLTSIGAVNVFDYIITADDVEHHKPAPDAYLLACRRLGVQASRSVVFEDAPNGIHAAKAAATRCVGVITPYCNPTELSEADRLVHSLENITLADLQSVINQ